MVGLPRRQEPFKEVKIFELTKHGNLLPAAFLSGIQIATTRCLSPIARLTEKRREFSARPRILVLSMGGIGDTVLVLPFLVALRKKYPAHEITLIARTYSLGMSQLISGCVDREIGYRFGISALARLAEPFRALHFVIAHKLNSQPELAVAPRWDKDNTGAGMVAFFSRAKIRLTFSEKVSSTKSAWNWLYDSLYTHLEAAPESLPEVEKISALAAKRLFADVPPLAGLLGQSEPKTPEDGLLSISIAPFAGHPRREWTTHRWAALLKAIAAQSALVRFTLFCADSETRRAEEIAAKGSYKYQIVRGESFERIVSTMQRTSLFIGADSGLAHLAGASGIPVIQLSCHPYGAPDGHYNSPVRWAVSSPRTSVIRPAANPGCENGCRASRPCCIENIQVSSVLASVNEHLSKLTLGKADTTKMVGSLNKNLSYEAPLLLERLLEI